MNYNIIIILLLIILVIILLIIIFRKKESFKIQNTRGLEKFPILYINLDKNTERNTNILNQLKKYNIKNFKKIEGIDGKKLNLKEGQTNNIKYKQIYVDNENEFEPSKNKKNLSPGELGCLFAHIKAIQFAYYNNLGTTLILEDDVLFDQIPFWLYDLDELIKYIPDDWNIIQLHHLDAKLDINKLYTKNKICWSCAAYLINRKGQQNIIESIKKELIIDNKEEYVADNFLYSKSGNYYVINIPYFLLNIRNLTEKSSIRTFGDFDNFMFKSNDYFINIYKNIKETYDKLNNNTKIILNLLEYRYNKHEKYKNINIFYKNNEYLSIIFSYELNLEKMINDIRNKYKNIKILLCDFEPTNLHNINLTNRDILLTTKRNKNLLPKNDYFSIYIPYYIFWIFEANIKFSNIKTYKKNKFCCFAYSNCDENLKGVKFRKNFYIKIQELTNNKVDNLGKCYNTNINKKYLGYNNHINNYEIFKNYKFVIAIENEQIEGYISEKILNPMLAGSIPIYYGAPDISKHFNPKRFINISDYNSIEDCINYILEVDKNEELYNKIINEPIFSYNFNINRIENFLKDKLINQFK
jgi:GR25 family glycosyltransferase involved in LPS biosynthesis